jgi:hypothetical protein
MSDLFRQTHARAGDRETSHLAAEKKGRTEARGPTQRNASGRILAVMQYAMQHGRRERNWTPDEMADVLKADVHQRFSDLEKFNYIELANQRRDSHRGSSMDAWKLTPLGALFVIPEK